MENITKQIGDWEADNADDIILNEIDSLEAALVDAATADTKPTTIQYPLGGVTTYVDIVFCIDVTASMSPIISTIKNLILDVYDDLITNTHVKNDCIIKQLRVKVIAFRDYYRDGPYAMEESEFFTLPEQKNELRNFVASLEARGGGDESKNALEAMALAMKSDWVKVTNPNTEKARNVIVIFTDAPAHPFEKAVGDAPECYPKDMLESYSELFYAWHPTGYPLDGNNINHYDMDKRAKRLIGFVPEDVYPWEDIFCEFEYAAALPISTVSQIDAFLSIIGDAVQ